MDILNIVGNEGIGHDMPDFRAGDTVKVHYTFIENEKKRTQIFRGIILQKRGSGINKTFTVRKISYGVAVEKVFPLYSPLIDKIEILSRGHTRRAKLFYIRDKKGKKSKIRISKKRTLKEIQKAKQ
ncbi:MAG: 50S ribosomal protein L19 [Candidatus Cloacimonadota bacterium]|nr:50S ribosomal protein L19 [Candidatus Cloacimonadota bacterium]